MDSDLKLPSCARCGAHLPVNSPGGWCPRCALEQIHDAAGSDMDLHILDLRDIPAPGTKVSYIGDYELMAVVAHGGMGVIYRARQRSLNRTVALKLLLGGAHASAGFKRRFRQEAETAAKLQHPGIIPIYEVGEYEGQPYYSMEYVEGTNLSALTSGKPLSPRKAAEYVKAVAEAIAYAHQQGVLHRDLKPSNILLGRDDRPRVTDFGLARQMDAESSLTLSGDMLGTPGYLPPEQVVAQKTQIGPRSDVYSLGAVLYHLLTGRPPFIGTTIFETLQMLQQAAIVPPSLINPEVPKELEAICLKCLQKSPERRFASAQELAGQLDGWLAACAHFHKRDIFGNNRNSLRGASRFNIGIPAVLLLVLVLVSVAIIIFAFGRARSSRESFETTKKYIPPNALAASNTSLSAAPSIPPETTQVPSKPNGPGTIQQDLEARLTNPVLISAAPTLSNVPPVAGNQTNGDLQSNGVASALNVDASPQPGHRTRIQVLSDNAMPLNGAMIIGVWVGYYRTTGPLNQVQTRDQRILIEGRYETLSGIAIVEGPAAPWYHLTISAPGYEAKTIVVIAYQADQNLHLVNLRHL